MDYDSEFIDKLIEVKYFTIKSNGFGFYLVNDITFPPVLEAILNYVPPPPPQPPAGVSLAGEYLLQATGLLTTVTKDTIQISGNCNSHSIPYETYRKLQGFGSRNEI